MENSKIKILLIEDDPGGASFWEQILAEIKDVGTSFAHIEQLSDFSHATDDQAPDIILLDLSLPEGSGFELFQSVYQMAAAIPIIVITQTDDQNLALQTTLAGAQDCLVKSDIGSFLLSRSMRYAIGRQKHLKDENAVSSVDELTGLYNRRGFLTRADKQIKIADQMDQSLLMVFADVDELKAINDTLGHHWGDMALMEMAHVLREAFRETDILGRLSGDEFVALLNCGHEITEDYLIKRFRETLEEHNHYPERHFQLSASIGIARYEPHTPCSVGELLVRADSVMYRQKKPKNGPRGSRSTDEKREPVPSILTQFLAETRDEAIVRLMLPLLKTCGFDQGLSQQLSAWITQGSRELKLSLIRLIEEINDAQGGAVLLTALFDDSEEIAALAARAVGKIHFTAGLKTLLKTAELWETRAPESELFLTAVCQSLGDLAQFDGIPFLQDTARDQPLRRVKAYSLALRLEAVQALGKMNLPETWIFLKRLAEEKNTPLREVLQDLIRSGRSA